MYIVAIGWLYVVILMSLTESSVIAGLLTFVFFGLAPCALVLWLFGGPGRRRSKNIKRSNEHAAEEVVADSVTNENVHKHNRADTKAD
ncbi:MAG: hypothetical protein WCL29_03960 [Pseudomonadota bacterium]